MQRARVLALGLAALLPLQVKAQPDGGQARPPAVRFIIPKPLDVVEVPSDVRALGAPVRIRAVRSAAPLETVMDELVKQYIDAGLYIPPRAHLTRMTANATLQGIDPDTFIAYGAIFQPNPDKTTTVILTETYLSERTRVSLAFAPLMPGAQGVIVTEAEGSRTQVYRVRATPAAIRAFYARELAAKGYREEEDGIFGGPAGELKVTLSPRVDGTVSVAVFELGPRAPAGGP